MKIETRKITDLKPYAHNPKTHPEEQVDKIARSIEEFGFLVPILIDADNSIIAGHGRILAAKKLGLTEIPTIQVDHLTEAQIRAYRIADNRLTESAWDLEMLESEIAILEDMDFDIDLTGFDDIELGELFPADPEPEDFDAVAAMDDESVPLVQAGELWMLGDHRLLCGDSTKSEDVGRLMGGERADMVFTDPPYGMKKDIIGDELQGDDMREFHKRWMYHFSGIPSLIWYDPKRMSDVIVVAETLIGRMTDYLHLYKPNDVAYPLYSWIRTSESMMIFCETQHNEVKPYAHDTYLWNHTSKDKSFYHPTVKPIEIVCDVISRFDADIIIDPFGGSGTTLIACEQLNRRCYMMEIDPHYCGVILDRWANYTKEDPIREDGVMWSELKQQQL